MSRFGRWTPGLRICIPEAEVLPACDEPDLEDALDRVSAELDVHDAALFSVQGGVLVVLEVEHDDVLEVYGQAAVALAQVVAALRRHWNVDFDDAGAIGRRYRRQDEIGTPFCVTVDFDTLTDQAVTVRERDTMQQERISLDGISAWFGAKLVGA